MAYVGKRVTKQLGMQHAKTKKRPNNYARALYLILLGSYFVVIPSANIITLLFDASTTPPCIK
jgi:hypothetical protein